MSRVDSTTEETTALLSWRGKPTEAVLRKIDSIYEDGGELSLYYKSALLDTWKPLGGLPWGMFHREWQPSTEYSLHIAPTVVSVGKELPVHAHESVKVKIDQGGRITMSKLEDTIASRVSVHGDFTNTARVAQHLKGTIALELQHSGHDSDLPDAVMREGMDMIVSKIARIISGNPYESDHWHDIACYASLVEKSVRETREKSNDK